MWVGQMRRQFPKQMKLLAILPLLAMAGCVQMTLAWTNLNPDGPVAEPSLLPETAQPEDWNDQRKHEIRDALEAHVYGVMPDQSDLTIVERKTIDENAFDGLGIIEEVTVQATATFNGTSAQTPEFRINIVLPKQATTPSPVIMMASFCPRWDTIRHPDIYRPEGAGSCVEGFASPIFGYIFGRYNATPPMKEILSHGFGFAAIFPGEFIPDAREAGLASLREMSAGHTDDTTRWGAIGAWGWAYSRIVDVLAMDNRVDQDGIISYGHSRYGKSALIVAAFDDRVDGVIAHQSGTGGASLNRQKRGESVNQITDQYPHWFSHTYAAYAGREEEMPIDQHHLLALVAPRPMLLGNARRDVWSDPNGAYRAAEAADAVYELYGHKGLDQKRLNDWRPEADIAFWIRPGTHGTVREDWPAFLEFLDAHFAPEQNSVGE